MVKKAFYKGSLFILIVMIIVILLNPIFIIKTPQRNKLIQGLYEHTGDAYDVVFLGSSHMNAAINPNILWNHYGITSYNYATGGQPIDVTYYLLKEILKNHKKPIVVLDIYYLGLTQEFGEEGYIRTVLDNMKFSKNKVEAILKCTPRPHWISYLFPVFKYHDRWKEIDGEDFNLDTSDSYYLKGFGDNHNLYGKDNLSNTDVEETSEIPPKSKEYLYKIIELSQKEDFKLIFTNFPHDYTATNISNIWHNEPPKMYNKIAEIAKKNNIPYLNYYNEIDNLNFDFKSDMNDSSHMNIWGANKITADVGKYLKENYELADHRNDKKYANWQNDYLSYQQAEQAAILKAEKQNNR
jgi:hypothetical protein